MGKSVPCLVLASGLLAASLGAASAADMVTKAPLVPTPMVQTGPWVELFGGATVAPDSVYGEGGAVFGISHDLTTDGLLGRFKVGGGNYEYNRYIGFSQSVDFVSADAMLGYQKFVGATRLTGYIGANVESHDNNSDPYAKVAGTRWGAKFQGEIYTPFATQWYLFGLGSYSTAFNTYYVQGKVGYQVLPNISFGPQVEALGNDRFDAVRLGPFVAFNITPASQIILSGGYSWDTRSDWLNDHSGGFFNAHLRGTF